MLRLYPEEDHEIIMGAKSCATPYIFMYVCDYFRGCCHIEEGAFTFVSDTLYAFHIADTCSIWRQYIRGEIWHMMKFIPGNASQIGPSAPVFLLYYFQDYFYLCFIWFHEVCVGKEIQCRGCPISRAATSFWTSEIPLPNLFWQVKKKERKKRERVWLEVKGTLAL